MVKWVKCIGGEIRVYRDDDQDFYTSALRIQCVRLGKDLLIYYYHYDLVIYLLNYYFFDKTIYSHYNLRESLQRSAGM